jgi:hypothetical protein
MSDMWRRADIAPPTGQACYLPKADIDSPAIPAYGMLFKRYVS